VLFPKFTASFGSLHRKGIEWETET
jgi:hypothetical protein